MSKNKEKKLPNFFWIGPQKSASTWAYKCFQEHPEIYVHEDERLAGIGGDALHYFDIHYHKGIDWYKKFFQQSNGEKAIVDSTPSYIRSPKAAKRISKDIPDAKIITCLRNPIDRAFSHYWHKKKKEKIDFAFKDVLENYDLFQNWIEPGFYYMHLKKYFDEFGEDNILVMLLSDLKKNDRKFIREIFQFLEVDSRFEPSLLDEKVNTAGYKRNWKWRTLRKITNSLKEVGVRKKIINTSKTAMDLFKKFKAKVLDKNEYEEGMDPEIRQELKKIYKPDIKKLEGMIEKDLSHWLN